MDVRRCGFGLGLMVMLASAGGCGSSNEAPSGPKLLTIASPGSEDRGFNALLDVLRQRVPGIEITVQVEPGCSTTRCTGEPPDVFMTMAGQDTRELAANGRIDSIDA